MSHTPLAEVVEIRRRRVTDCVTAIARHRAALVEAQEDLAYLTADLTDALRAQEMVEYAKRERGELDMEPNS